MEAVNKSGFCSAPNNRPKTSERPEKPTSRVGPPPPGHQEAPLCASARAATPRRVYLDRLSFYSIRNSRASRRRSENFVGEEQGGKLVSFPLFFFGSSPSSAARLVGPQIPLKGIEHLLTICAIRSDDLKTPTTGCDVLLFSFCFLFVFSPYSLL